MFYDQNGRPDANGQFEMKGGKLARRASSVLQHGERIAFDLALMDAAPANNLFLTDSATKFTDAERSLADSAEGQMLITQARASHNRKNAYLGDRAPAFTTEQAAGVIRNAAAQKIGAQNLADRFTADEAALRAQVDEARRRNSLERSQAYRQR